jgi:hypothetical protein
MAFTDFAYPEVLDHFGLYEAPAADLFVAVPPAQPGVIARNAAEGGAKLALLVHSEKARSEWIVAPILYEAWARFNGRVGLYSGLDFPADPDANLTGFCDFLLGRSPQSYRIRAPLAVVFEAKRDSIPEGLGQCIAAMVGIQRFNRREGTVIDPIFGCVTTGSLWRFLQLEGSTMTVDVQEYQLHDLEKLLGILISLYDPQEVLAKAS